MLWYIGENWNVKGINMRKYIVGFLVGAIFTLSTSVFADDIQSLIGRKVQAESTVSVDGQKLTTIVVEGKNYAPVRSLGEAAGYTVTVDGKDVIMSTSEVKEKYRLEKIKSLETAISVTEKVISDANALLISKKEESLKFTSDSDVAIYSRIISDLEKKIAQSTETLEQQKANLTALQPTP
jgi:cobalamin biosynthesis protein CbiG